jgi:hypothetical protein
LRKSQFQLYGFSAQNPLSILSRLGDAGHPHTCVANMIADGERTDFAAGLSNLHRAFHYPEYPSRRPRI